jgi:hypothetical protein
MLLPRLLGQSLAAKMVKTYLTVCCLGCCCFFFYLNFFSVISHNQNLTKSYKNVFVGVMQVYDYSRKQKTGIVVGRLAKFIFSKRLFIFNLKWKRLILEYRLIFRNGMITLQ